MPNQTETNTGGGAGISGDVNTNGGDFAGRDGPKNATNIEIKNSGNNDYRYIALETRVTNLQAEMINHFLILENQREATQERHNDIHEELRSEIRRLDRREPMPVTGTPMMQVINAILMTIVIIVMLYGIYILRTTAAQLLKQGSTQQSTAIGLK